MALIHFIKNDEISNKLFTKAEREIIQKQLRGIPLTQSQKNVLSKNIRKKLQAIKKCSLYENEFDMKKGQYSYALISNAIDELKQDKRIKRIYLFGSFLTQSFNADSDIDICIEFWKISEKDATIFLKNMYSLVDEQIDLTVFNQLPGIIQAQITKNGRIIYENSRENN